MTSAGSCATTLATVTVPKGGTGATTLGSGLPLFGNGTSAGTISGTGTKLASTTGALTSTHCVQIDASGNFVDAGGACTTGGGGGTVVAGTINQLAFYAAGGTSVSGETLLQCLNFPALTGDITTSSGACGTTVATVNAGPGVVGSSTAIPVLTTNGKGLVTAQSTAAVVAPASTLTGATLAAGVTASSLTSVGTLGSLGLSGAITDTQAIGATSTDGLLLTDVTPATVGAQKWSPRIHWSGQGWKTNATAGSQSVDVIAELQPVQGTASPSGNLVISQSINGGAYGALLTLPTGGGLNLNSGNYQIGGSQIAFSNIAGTALVPQGGTGVGTFTSNLPLIGNGTGNIGQGTVTGTTTEFATFSGFVTPARCVHTDANGNLTASAADCIAPPPASAAFDSGTAISSTPSTASSSFVMAGFGSTATITPANTGRLMFTITGGVGNNTQTGQCFVELRIGNGTAPAAGVAVTGTLLGNATVMQNQSASAPAVENVFPFTITGVATGQALGTAIWFDAALEEGTAGTYSATNSCGRSRTVKGSA